MSSSSSPPATSSSPARARDFQSSLDQLDFQTVAPASYDLPAPHRRERDRDRDRPRPSRRHPSSSRSRDPPPASSLLQQLSASYQQSSQNQHKYPQDPPEDNPLAQPSLAALTADELTVVAHPLDPIDERDNRNGTFRSPRALPALFARFSSAANSGPGRTFRKQEREDSGSSATSRRGQRSTERRTRETSGSRERGATENRSLPLRENQPGAQSHNSSAPANYQPSTSSRRSRDTQASSGTERSTRPARSTSRGFGAPFLIDQNLLESQLERDSKMHQTSSRLLRMTDDDRPFTRDFKDLFSTLMVSLPLTPHRVRFQKIDHTFTSDEAITNLGSLKFSQSNRMPDPKDPSRIVTTTTTTTFSMAKEMARSVCSKFLEARFIESVDGKSDFHSKNAVWQLTPKGMSILQRFCQRNGITARHVMEVLESARNTMHLVILEREAEGDKLFRDQATIEVIFRRFVGVEGPNIKYSTSTSDSDSLNDYQTGLIGVKMANQRKVGDKTYFNSFTGKATIDWLMDCCTMVDARETVELATLFVEYGLMQSVNASDPNMKFSPSKTSIYQVTEKGKRVAGWVASPKLPSTGENSTTSRLLAGASRDSNANRMTIIIRDPALRLLFREFLRDTHCEENLAFYIDVREFLNTYNAAKRSSATPRLEVIRETLAAAYSLYNAFLAPGSPCELNIDHSLRTALAARMTRAVGDDEAMIKSLDEVASLFDQAQHSVFKLMASDSVPKFLREAKYAQILRDRNLDVQLAGGPLNPGTRTVVG